MQSIRQLKDSNPEVSKRFYNIAIKYGIIFGIGLTYLFFVLLSGLRIPCVFYEFTGLKCPGCGITRMIVSLAKLNFTDAFGYNPFLFITGPFILIYLAISEIKYVLCGNRKIGKWEIFIPVELILAIAYGVLRNIYPI
jgi:hypothetical protein